MIFRSCLLSLLLCLSIGLSCAIPAAQAQIPTGGEKAADKSADSETPRDLLGRDTPRGLLKGFLNAVATEDYEEAARYLDLSGLSRAEQSKGPLLAQDLQKLLDRQGWMQPDGALSVEPEGHTNDGLAPDLDNIASLRTADGSLPIHAQRVTGADKIPVWLVSSAFVKQIPALTENLGTALIDRIMIGDLDTFKIRGAPVGHWLAMIALYGLAYMLSGFIVRAFIRIVRKIFHGRHKHNTPSEKHLIDAFETPLRLSTMILLASLAAVFVGVSVIVRHVFMPVSIVIGFIALGIFLWRLSDLCVSLFERRMAARERYGMSSMLAFARRGAKLFFSVLIVILILDAFGVDVTAGLAALGIGGLALALGAQKTLENFIGSLSIIADHPFHVGDFCKIGETSGTIEDIGMRSTRLRTNDRTLVTIPNGELSSQRIENFARRTRFLLNRKFVLRYDAKSGQIRDFMARCNAIIAAQEKIIQEGTTVRLLGFSETGYMIELFCNVQTHDFNQFLIVQAEVTLQIIDAASEAGVYFAIPSQTFVPAIDQIGRPAQEQTAPKA